MKIQFYLGKVFAFFGLLLLINSCSKKPESQFAMLQYEYAAGDAILYENYSVNDKVSNWEILNSENEVVDTFAGKYPNIVIGILNPDGAYTLRLNSSKKNNKKTSSSEKEFLIKCERTNLNVNFNSSGSHNNYDVYVDNQYVGSPPEYLSSFQVKIPVGYRLVKFVDGETIEEHSVLFGNSSVYLSF